ncbi:MAG: 4Fe-4S dicluster domain-containing protein [Chitinophagales bacterium]|nr:4Fe-4S dicluster domain-containing protein [Chitinophagales bacterium]
MKKDNQPIVENAASRRNFLKFSIASGALAMLSQIGELPAQENGDGSGEKVRLLNSEGKLVEVDKSAIKPLTENELNTIVSENRKRARKGIEGRKWVMVIDLARCKHALNCQEACNKHHHIPGDRQWLNVYKMQNAENTAPYWMPKTCFHCDNPPCVSVCPVDATFKRDDGIVLIDNERCIGCRFCMAGCPYSTRVFNWGEPENQDAVKDQPYDPEKSLPRKKGTVEKCDFCPDMLRMGHLPHCITACPNGVFFFGDRNEDTVTNGSETYKFSKLMEDKAGYRYLEDLGTEPNVYYLPPVDRLVPFDKSDNLPPVGGHDHNHKH